MLFCHAGPYKFINTYISISMSVSYSAAPKMVSVQFTSKLDNIMILQVRHDTDYQLDSLSCISSISTNQNLLCAASIYIQFNIHMYTTCMSKVATSVRCYPAIGLFTPTQVHNTYSVILCSRYCIILKCDNLHLFLMYTTVHALPKYL